MSRICQITGKGPMTGNTVSHANNRSKKVIPWSQVMFFNADHMGITEDPSFADNLLYFLLERPDD